MVTIEIETPTGIRSIDRDKWHTDKDGWVVAYDDSDARGVEHKFLAPIERVVAVHE